MDTVEAHKACVPPVLGSAKEGFSLLEGKGFPELVGHVI